MPEGYIRRMQLTSPAMERTFVAVKPDGVGRGLVGVLFSRFEAKGLKMVGLKLMLPSREVAELHYGEHKGKPFFTGLCDFFTSGPIVAMCWEGMNAIEAVRVMMGATNPKEAAPGTIRGDLALDIGRNVIHGSDSPQSAAREIGLFFGPEELVSWDREIDKHLYEGWGT